MATHDREMTLLEHLDELRVRLTRAVLGLLVATTVGLIFVDQLLVLLLHPLGGLRLTTLTVLEPFLVKMKISFLFGIVLSMPWIVYQLFAFINPALTEHERRKIRADRAARRGAVCLRRRVRLRLRDADQHALAARPGGRAVQRADHRQLLHHVRLVLPGDRGRDVRDAAADSRSSRCSGSSAPRRSAGSGGSPT